MDGEEVKSLYEASLERWRNECDDVKRMLEERCREKGIKGEVSGRVKTFHSLLAKVLIRKKEFSEISDKIGVRVVLMFPDQKSSLEDEVSDMFKIVNRDAKDKESNVFEYSGLHLDCQRSENSDVFELQIHTLGQSLWAKTIHDLIYKPEIADMQIKRTANRLSAVMEIVDGEVENMREEIKTNSEMRVSVVAWHLRDSFFRLTGFDYNQETTVYVLEKIVDWIHCTHRTVDEWGAEFESFVESNREILSQRLKDYRGDPRNPLVSQPEGLLILYFLHRNRNLVIEKWPSELGTQLLESFKNLWASS